MFAGLGLLAAGPIQAERRVSGDVSGTWRRDESPIIVTNHIALGANATLTIESGVTVQIQGNYRFTVNGALSAVGQEHDSIYFIGGGQPGSWVGLSLAGASSDRSLFRYCSIRHAFRGITLDDSDPTIQHCAISICSEAGVRFSRSLGQLLNCWIDQINANGVAITDVSRAKVRNCRITRCGDHGIAVAGNANPVMTDNLIEDPRDNGISLASAGACSLAWNTIHRAGQKGLSVSESNGVIAYRNIFNESGSSGVYVTRSNNFNLINNTVLASGQHGLQAFSNVNGNAINNILGNSGLNGIFVSTSNVVARYNDVFNSGNGDYNGINEGQGDIHQSPGLDENFWPGSDSPVVDAGDANYIDPDGTRSDIGGRFYNRNHPPVIESWSPDTLIRVGGDSAVVFSIQVREPDGQPIWFTWTVNGVVEWRNTVFTRRFNRDGQYTVQVTVDDRYWMGQTNHFWQFTVEGAAVRIEPTLPEGYALSEAFPNPFNGSTRFSVTVPRKSVVGMSLTDMQGRLVRTLFTGEMTEGTHTVVADCDDLPAGEYFLKANLGGNGAVRRVVLIK
jgi:hypothetical protein